MSGTFPKPNRLGRLEQIDKAPCVLIHFERIRRSRFRVVCEGQVGWEEVIVPGGKQVQLKSSCPGADCGEALRGQGPVMVVVVPLECVSAQVLSAHAR